MKNPNFHPGADRAAAKFWYQSFLPSLLARPAILTFGLIAALIFSPANLAKAQAPDLTNGGVRTDDFSWNLGATGMAGWFYRPNWSAKYAGWNTEFARQSEVMEVSAGSPAAGILQLGDVILGADGTGAEPVAFTADARKSIAYAIADAEARSPATLKLLVWRAGTTSTMSLTLETLGAYSATAPYNCPKSAAILEKGLNAVMASGGTDDYKFSLITLLAGNDPSNPNNAARMARAQQEAHALILTPQKIAEYTAPFPLSDSKVAWTIGFKLTALAEYYLHTEDPAVYESLRAYAIATANGQSMFGTSGHQFSKLAADGSLNGPYGIGYGIVNSANMQCFLGLTLAKQAGVIDQAVLDAVERASKFYSAYVDRGTIPYGEHEPGIDYGDNGKSGIAALCFKAEGTRNYEANYYATLAASAAHNLDAGHTGPYLNYLWTPLGANAAGEQAMAAFFAEQSWRFDLARNWDGSFTYNSYQNGGLYGYGGSTWASFRMYQAMLLPYAVPLRETYLTGKNTADPAKWIGTPELNEIQISSGYDATTRTTAELLADLDNWSPITRIATAAEIGKRTSEHATLLPTLHSMATDINASLQSRMGACRALGAIKDGSSVSLLVGLLTDSDTHIKWEAATALRQFLPAALMPEVDAIMTACIVEGKPVVPVDAEDPIHLTHMKIVELLFDKMLRSHDLVGIDRDLLIPAIRAGAVHPMGMVRGDVGTVYRKLSRKEVEALADVLVDGTLYEAPADRMFSVSVRMAGLNAIQSHNFAEGVRMAMSLALELNSIPALDTLIAYAADSLLVEPDHKLLEWLDIIEAGDSGTFTAASNWPNPGNHNHLQWVRDAIANDPGPYVKPVPFKRIYSVVADDATLTLPDSWTGLHVGAYDFAKGDSAYTWRKVHGAGEVSFYPNGTAAAKDTTVIFDGTPGNYLFEVKISDSLGLSEARQTVAVTLEKVGGGLDLNSAPTANDQSVTTAQGTQTAIILTGSDPEAYALTYTVTSGPSHGTLSGTAPSLVYTASVGYTGTDSISFEVMDSEGQVAIGTVSILVNAAAPVSLAIYEPFMGYPLGTNLNGLSGTGEIGLAGTWTAGADIYTVDPGYTYGPLPTTGSKLWLRGLNAPGQSRPINPDALTNSGLLADGATLWFSVLIGADDTHLRRVSIALANASFQSSTSNIQDDGADPGTGLGLHFDANSFYAAQFFNASQGGILNGDFDEFAAGKFVRYGDLRLVVGKISWGADSDLVELYLPLLPKAGASIVLPDKPSSTLVANVDQSKFDVLTVSRGQNLWIDEIRFGATLQSVLMGTLDAGGIANDGVAPAPNPMTFAIAPRVSSQNSITMTATPAYDPLGVEYYFTCTTGAGGSDSGWQDSTVYTNIGLTPGVAYSYTVKARDKTPGLNETAASAAASATIPSSGTVPNLVGIEQSIAETLLADAGMVLGTVTQSGAYSMTVPAGHVLSQSPADGASVAYGSAVNLVISIGQDPVLPVLTPVNIVDDRNGETVELGTPVTFTLTFSKDIDAATLNAGDFINFGDAPVSIGSITETSPGVVTVSVTPNGTGAGILRFAVAQGAIIKDTLGNDLNTLSAIIDDTVISVIPVQPKTQVFSGNNSGSGDNWNNALNWNVNSGPIPTGTDNVVIPAGKQVSSNSTLTPIYEGNLTIGSGAILQAGYSVSNINVFNCIGTAGKTMIFMGDGSRLIFRNNFTVPMPAITLQGNAEIMMGENSAGTDPIFNYPITGPYTLTLGGRTDSICNFNSANNFGHLLFAVQRGTDFTVNANVAGSLGGDVTVLANPLTGGVGAKLVFAAANAMSDSATLSLYGNTGTLVTVNANDTIGTLKLNGVKQLPGAYNSGNSSWLAGTGTLTVPGGTMVYWNPAGGPAGTWDDSNIWNTLANLTGFNNAWVPGQIAVFNAAGTYGVTLGGTREIEGLVVSNGTLTLSGGGLSLGSDGLVNVGSGASLAINTVIEQNSLGLGLHKSGAGMLNLLGENTFTGPVAIGAGILSVATIDNAGAPSALGQYPDSGIGGLILAGGTLRYTGGPATVNRGFTFTGNSTIDVANAGSSLALGDVETAGPGTLHAIGGAGSNLGLGNMKLALKNNLTLNPTTTTMSVASVDGSGIATLTLGGTATGNVVTGNIFADSNGIIVVKTGTGDWRLAGALSSAGVAHSSLKVNDGTLTLAGSNTYTGNTSLSNNAKLVLDYATTDSSKLADSSQNGLELSGGTLELKGGTHVEVVNKTVLYAGPTSLITRNGGTAKLRMNAITRSAQSSISFLDGTVADTDRVNTNGILGGYATAGGDWAVNSTNGTDGAITALTSYDNLPNSGGAAAANQLLSGSATLSGAVTANSLKIAHTDLNQTLDLGAHNLTITSTSATTLGGLLYAGEGFDRYTINGSGGLLASSTTGELVVHTHGGTLTVNAPMVTSGATAGLLTKSGDGNLVLGGSNVYTGATRVASGKLFVNGSLSNVNAALTVDAGATLGGAGTVGRNITIAHGGKLEFNLAAGTHVPLNRGSSRTFAFSGSSILTITSSAGASPGLCTLVTGGNNITGSVPATVILPPGWTADPPVISGSELRINITNVVYPPNAAPVWSGNPVIKTDATENAAYSATLANNVNDLDSDPLTFAKVSGPAWLIVAANGALSGTPGNGDVGANSFTVSVSDGTNIPVETTLHITVINVNDAPVWNSDPLVGPDATEDVAYSQNISTAASDVDAEGPLTFAKVNGPSWLNVAANGIISGTPANDDVGLNVFTVSVSDGIASPVEASLHITVINTNDAPVWTSNPITGASALEDSPYAGSLSGSAVDVDAGASLTFAKVSGPAWLNVAANGTLSGTPTNSDVGPNSFTVSVSDGIAAAVQAILNITVINTNDAPIAISQSVTAPNNTPLPITLTGVDDDNDPLTYSIITQPAHGTLSGTAPNVSYTPTPSYTGPDSFTFKVNDGTVDSNIATVSITVTAPNDPPLATAQSLTTDEDTALPITLTASDPDENPLTWSIVTPPANGTLSGAAPNVTYSPTADYNGPDSFTFKVNDGTYDSNIATVSITVSPVNDAPVFTTNPIILAGGSENVAYTGQTLAGRATDVDSGDTLSYSKISGPLWLEVASNGALTGTPPSGSAGLNSFVVRATDSASATADATLEIGIAIADLTWANSYISSLDVSLPTTVISARNFPSFLDGPLTGSSPLTHKGFFQGQSSFVNNAGNTFDGNIIVDSGTLRIAGGPFASNGGFIAPGMTSSDSITIHRAGVLTIDDNVADGYTANRFGGNGNRPAVNLAGGTINLSGLNNASSSVQTFGTLTSSSGQATITLTRNTNGNPTLIFPSLAISPGSVINFYSAALGTGTNDARITFGTAPTLTNGIIAGAKVWNPGAAGVGDFATYGANGVTAFTAYDVFGSNDINGATSTQNVRLNNSVGGAGPVALAADTTVNSLNINGNGGTWAMGNKLTIASGMILRNGTNQLITISSGTLTAGTGSAIDLHFFTAQQNMTMSGTSVIADNGVGGVVTLVKSHGNQLSLNNGGDNTYSGGTYVVDGTLSTSTTANRRYLGSGKVTVDNATLTLGNVGATSNASGDDYTAINTGRINIASGTNGVYTAADTFNIGANSIISGGSASGQGLASLTRGTNITLAENAVIGHGTQSAALNLTTGTIQNLGTSADLYYGLNASQGNAGGQITIGTGTAFKGISGMRTGNINWDLGTINVATGTSAVYFQSMSGLAYAAPDVFALGNGATAGGILISLADEGTLDVNLSGRFNINDTAAVFGDTSTGRNVRFVVTAGSELGVGQAAGMGSGTGIASALVQNGGFIRFSQGATATDAFNGAVTVQAGGRFDASLAGGLTGTGALTFNEGSLINITNVTGFSGTQATAANVNAGTIVRLNTGNWGSAGTTLDSILGSGANSVTYQFVGQQAVNPTASGTAVYTLNKSAGGVGGVLTNDIANRTVNALTNGDITLGANGGVIAATTNTTFTISENVTGAGSLTAGTTAIIDGAPKLGTVSLNTANDYSGGTIVNAGTLTMGNAAALGSTSGSLTVNGGTMNMAGNSLTVGNLTGSGGVISGTANNRTLTIGQGDNGGGNFQGVITNGTGGTTNLTKTGTGTITLSGNNTYTGATNINAGTLFMTGASQATTSIAVSANCTLGLNVASTVTASNATVSLGGSVQVTGTLTSASRTLLTASSITGTPVLSPAIPGYTLVIEGGNTLKLNSISPLGFSAWQAANNTSGGRDADHDEDGVANGIEHFVGGNSNTTGPTPLPSVVKNGGTLRVTWVRHEDYPGFPANYGTDFVVETSPSLAGPWTAESSPGNVAITGNHVIYTFPGGPAYTGKRFVRLKVSGP